MLSGVEKDIYQYVSKFLDPITKQLFRMTCSYLQNAIVIPRGKRTLLLNAAASSNYIEIVKWCFDNHFSRNSLTCMYGALSNNVEMFKYLVEKRCPVVNEIVIGAAASSGSLEMIRYIDSQGKSPSSIFHYAATSGHVLILEEYKQFYCKESIDDASNRGHLNVLEWAHDQGYTFSLYVSLNVAGRGHIHILEWLLSKGLEVHPDVGVEASCYGYLDILKWVVDNKLIVTTSFAIIWKNALQDNQLHIIKYLKENNLCVDMLKLVSKNSFANTNLDVAKYLYKEFGFRVSTSGSLDVVQWIDSENVEPTIDNYINACSKGHLDTIKYLYQNNYPINKACKICVYGNNADIELIKWAHKEGFSFNEDFIENVATVGRLDILQWAYDSGFSNMNKVFSIAVQQNYMDIYRWCFEKNFDFSEIECLNVARTGNLNALKYARMKGRKLSTSVYYYVMDSNDFEMLEWLIQIDPTKGQFACELAAKSNNHKFLEVALAMGCLDTN